MNMHRACTSDILYNTTIINLYIDTLQYHTVHSTDSTAQQYNCMGIFADTVQYHYSKTGGNKKVVFENNNASTINVCN